MADDYNSSALSQLGLSEEDIANLKKVSQDYAGVQKAPESTGSRFRQTFGNALLSRRDPISMLVGSALSAPRSPKQTAEETLGQDVSKLGTTSKYAEELMRNQGTANELEMAPLARQLSAGQAAPFLGQDMTKQLLPNAKKNPQGQIPEIKAPPTFERTAKGGVYHWDSASGKMVTDVEPQKREPSNPQEIFYNALQEARATGDPAKIKQAEDDIRLIEGALHPGAKSQGINAIYDKLSEAVQSGDKAEQQKWMAVLQQLNSFKFNAADRIWHPENYNADGTPRQDDTKVMDLGNAD